MEFDEFLALTARFLVEEDSEAMQEELREAFRMYDKEGNGYINVRDLREILRALDDKLTEDELDEMIAEIDTDGSGTVDFDGETTTLYLLIIQEYRDTSPPPPIPRGSETFVCRRGAFDAIVAVGDIDELFNGGDDF